MFLKNRNISSKIKRSKVTDYAALMGALKEFSITSRFFFWGGGGAQKCKNQPFEENKQCECSFYQI